MARRTTPLTATEIRGAKPKERDYKLFDGGGLYLLISRSGGKHWYQKYRFDGKEKKLALGAFPAVSLTDARAKREELKRKIAEGIDPAQERKARKEKIKKAETKKTNSFYNVSQKWLESYKDQVSENYHIRLERAFKNYVYPTIKEKPIDEVTRLDIVEILTELKERGLNETARRTATMLNKMFKWAVTHEYAPHNIMADIDTREVIGKKVVKHYPTFKKPKEIRGLLNAIDEYSGSYFTKMALKVLPYVFVRSENIRHMEWKEIDFEAKEWTIPAHKMKVKDEEEGDFTLPLPHQVITLLEEVKANATSSRYVFPGFRSDGKPMSDNTLIAALRRMGYTKEEFVPHSFRAMFSTIAYEYANREDGHGYTGEVIEACLAHKERNKIKEAYNRASYKEPMRGLMQWYADHLDKIRKGEI